MIWLVGKRSARRMSGIEAWGLITRPLFSGSVFVLALNDQILKARWPGFITGKLSDVAGVVMVAMLAGALTRSTRLGAAVTTVAFAALKLIPGIAEFVAPVLGGITRRDTADLLALVALIPAICWLDRRTLHPMPQQSQRSPTIAIRCVGLMCAVAATSATSCASVDSVHGVVSDGSTVWAQFGDTFRLAPEPEAVPTPQSSQASTAPQPRTEQTWVSSNDGGRTWDRSTAPSAVIETPDQTCLDSGLCFRLLSGEGVEEARIGESWRSSYAFTDEQRNRLRYTTDDCGDYQQFESLTIAGSGNEQTVIVAMATEGVLVREPSGIWNRVPVLELTPKPFGPPVWFASLLASPAVLLVISPLFLFARLAKRRGLAAMLVNAGCALSLAVVASAFLFGSDPRSSGPMFAIASGLVFLVSCVVASRRTPNKPSVGPWQRPQDWRPPQPENQIR
jgi:hypothetical protein